MVAIFLRSSSCLDFLSDGPQSSIGGSSWSLNLPVGDNEADINTALFLQFRSDYYIWYTSMTCPICLSLESERTSPTRDWEIVFYDVLLSSDASYLSVLRG